MSRSHAEPRDRSRRPPQGRSPPKGLRKKILVTPILDLGFPIVDFGSDRRPGGRRTIHHRRSKTQNLNGFGPCEPSPAPDDLRTSGRAFPDDHSHAGFPQGFIDATNSYHRLVVFWLTNTINRIVKEQTAYSLVYAGSSREVRTDYSKESA